MGAGAEDFNLMQVFASNQGHNSTFTAPLTDITWNQVAGPTQINPVREEIITTD